MKKYSFLPILALVLGIAVSAFTTNRVVENDLWYYTQTTIAGEDNPNNYVPLNGQDSFCGEGTVVCVIQAQEDPMNPGHPDLSEFTVQSRKQ